MAEAHKCDVKGCSNYGDGSPKARVTLSDEGVTLGLCAPHKTEIVSKYFPDWMPVRDEKPAEDVPAPGQA